MPSSVNRARTTFLVVAALLAFGPSPVQMATALVSADGSDPAAAAEPVALKIDPLTAESDEVVTTLRDLDEAVRERSDAVAAAEEAQASAAADLETAVTERTEAEERVTAGADTGSAAETIEPPSRRAFPLLHGGPLTTASTGYSPGLDEASDDLDDLDAATQREDEATVAADELAAATEAAATALAEAEALETAFVASVEDRVDAKLADAEAVEPTDPTEADAMRADEQAIAGSIDEITEARQELEAAAGEDATAAEAEDAAAAPKPSARKPAAKPAAAKPAAAPKPAPAPAPSPPPLPDPAGSASGVLAGVWCSDLVHQIVVDGSIGGNVQALVNDAFAGGVGLCAKSGFRSYAEQVELRRANCGNSDYGINHAPPSTCSPPTARPGTSNHEDGLAVDFSCADGQPMTHASPCYRWLAAHAAGYGLHNLPSEPWHWSVTGR